MTRRFSSYDSSRPLRFVSTALVIGGVFIAGITGCSASLISWPIPGLGVAISHGATSSDSLLLNVRVSHDVYSGHGEPYLAVNPHNPRNLLGAAMFLGAIHTTVGTFYSLDGGSTWHDNGVLPMPRGANFADDVTVAFDNRGVGFVDAMAGSVPHGGTEPTTNRGVYLWRTDNGGRSFRAPVAVAHGHCCDHPWLTVDTSRTGALYLVWGNVSSLSFSRSGDLGHTFTQPRTVSGAKDPAPGAPVVVVGPRGSVHVVYAEHSNPQRSPIEIVSSLDRGRSFRGPTIIAWEAVQVDLPGTHHGYSSLPTAAVDSRDGSVYVAFATYRRGTSHVDVLLKRSRDDGRTWRAAVRVNDDPPTDPTVSFQPQVAVTRTGAVYVSYFHYRPGRGGLIDVFLTRSTDHGIHFGASVRVTSVSFRPNGWLGDYQGLTSGPHRIYPFWNDARAGHMEIYSAIVPAPQ